MLLLGTVMLLLVADRTAEIVGRRDEAISEARQKLVAIARTGADRQIALVSDVRALLAMAVEMPEAGSMAGDACKEPFTRTADAVPWLMSLTIFRPDGSLVCSSANLSWSLNVADRAYFKDTLSTRSFVLSNFLKVRTDQRPGIVAGQPHIVGGEIDSLVFARLDLDWFNGIVARLGETSRTSVVLSDRDGNVVSAFPDQTLAGQKITTLGLRLAGPAALEEVLDVTSPEGIAMIVAATPLPHTGGRLFVGASRDAVVMPVERETLLSAAKLSLLFLTCAGLLWLGTTRLVLRPVSALAKVSHRLGEGDYAARVDETHLSPEMAALARAFNVMAGRLATREAELRSVNEHLSALATVDPLTGLANRRLFEERLEQEWRRAARTGRRVAAIVIDVDCFKAFNDTYGHPAGDLCLARVARVIGSGHRPGDLAARIGGEEFALVLPGADLHRALNLARLIRLEVEALAIPHTGSGTGRVTVSAGAAALFSSDTTAAADLLRAADEALYRAKRSGRNRVAGPEGNEVAARAS